MKARVLLIGLLMLPMGSSQAVNNPPDFDIFEVDRTSVDIVADAGGMINFRAHVHPGRDASGQSDEVRLSDEVGAVVLHFAKDGEAMFAVGMVKDLAPSWNKRDWIYELAVDDARMTTGMWSIDAIAYDAKGSAVSAVDQGFVRQILFTGGSPPAFSIALAGITPGPSGYDPIDLNSGDELRLIVDLDGQGHLIHRVYVTQTTDRPVLGPIDLRLPYVLGADLLLHGASTLSFVAEDRIGRVRTLDVPIVADVIAPSFEVSVPPITFHSVPFIVQVATFDDSVHQLEVWMDGARYTATAAPGLNVKEFELVRGTLGDTNLVLRFRDVHGQERSVAYPLTTVGIPADTSILAIVPDKLHPLAGEEVRLTVTAAQDGGVHSVTGNVTLTGSTAVEQVLLSPSGTDTVDFLQSFLPGVHVLRAHVQADHRVNETDDSDQNLTTELEVFLGRVIAGPNVYHIRSTTLYQPLEAVALDGRTFVLTSGDFGLGTVYGFTADGHELYWDPASPVTVLAIGTQVETEEDAPAIGVLALLAALGAAMWVRRR